MLEIHSTRFLVAELGGASNSIPDQRRNGHEMPRMPISHPTRTDLCREKECF